MSTIEILNHLGCVVGEVRCSPTLDPISVYAVKQSTSDSQVSASRLREAGYKWRQKVNSNSLRTKGADRE